MILPNSKRLPTLTLTLTLAFISSLTVSTLAKQTYSELLTNDNELIMLDKLKSQPARPPPPASSSSSSSSSPSSSQSVKSKNTSTNTNSRPKSEPNSTLDKTKLIVNIVYLRAKNNTAPSANDSTHSKLVYILGGDANNNNNNNKNSDSRSAKRIVSLVKPDRSAVSYVAEMTTRSRLANISLSKGCSMSALADTVIAVYKLYRNSFAFNHNGSTTAVDDQPIRVVHLPLLSALREPGPRRLRIGSSQACLDDFFRNFKVADNEVAMSLEDMRSLLGATEPTCGRMRRDAELTRTYVAELNDGLFTTTTNSTHDVVTAESYAPICDEDGFFRANQCDALVTCWCVSKLGDPVPDTVRRIGEQPVACRTFL